MENFLSFWTHYNTGIIETLVALIIILSLFLAYRSFLKKEEEVALAPKLDTSEIEKTLQRILETQQTAQTTVVAESADVVEEVGEDGEIVVKVAPAATDSAEVGKLRTALAEKQLSVQDLENQVLDLQRQLAEQALAPAASSVAADAPAVDTSALEGKIRDLESRLAEYEIISEDIADLNRYREENEKLKAQIGGGAAPAPAEVAPKAPAEEAPAPDLGAIEVEAESAPVNVEDLIDQALAESTEAVSPEPDPAEVTAAEIAPVEENKVPAEEDPANLIDDELMREFAEAVENQKSTSSVAEKAGDGKGAGKQESEDSSELMNEFENFVNKKS